MLTGLILGILVIMVALTLAVEVFMVILGPLTGLMWVLNQAVVEIWDLVVWIMMSHLSAVVGVDGGFG